MKSHGTTKKEKIFLATLSLFSDTQSNKEEIKIIVENYNNFINAGLTTESKSEIVNDVFNLVSIN